MSPIRIIGVGSPIGDDRIGWQAIDALAELGLAATYPAGLVTLKKLDRPGPGLLEHMRGADLAIIIDALVCAEEPGSVVALRPDEIARQEGLLSGHGLGVAETMALGQVLGDLPDRLLLLGIAIEQTDDILSNDSEIKPETLAELRRYICLEVEQALGFGIRRNDLVIKP